MLHKPKQSILTALLLAAALLTGCASGTTPDPEPEGPAEHAADFFAMDTYMSFRVYGGDEDTVLSCRQLVQSLEEELSVVKEDSAVYTLNHTGSVRLSDTAADLLARTLDLCAETDGALDVSVYPVVRAWGFTDQSPAEGSARIPSEETIRALLKSVDYRQIRLEGNDVAVPEGMELDLGAVAKGYAGQILADELRRSGVESAVLALGGNIQTVGSRPDGSPWRVGVQDPDGDGLLGVLSVSDLAVVTSGGYERFFTDDEGNVWWHIMDPRTGRPARSGLVSVTVLGNDGLRCDALSTALFILGPDAAANYGRRTGEFDMVLATEDGRLLLTPGAAAVFEPDEALTYQVEVIDG